MSNIKIILFNIFFLLAFYSHSFSLEYAKKIKPYCINFLENKNLKIELIEIDFEKNRKWQKNLIRAYLSDNNFITDEFKKKFKAKIIVKFSNNQTCIFKSKIRFSGDMRDHIKKRKNFYFSSMDIKIEDNIFGIVKFKLLIPETRNNENEVFANLFLKEIGYLSPRSLLVDVNIFNNKLKYIMVESNLRKEFLENNSRVEGPILSVDDQYIFNKNNNLKSIAVSKLRNVNWIKDDQDKLELSIEAMTLMNEFFFQQSYRQRHYSLINGNFDNYETFFLKNYNDLQNYYEYVIYVLALGATHHLSLGDSRYYYDPYKKKFEIIFNDGESSIIFLPEKINFSIIENFPKINFENILVKINNLENDIFLKKLNAAGLSLNFNQYNKIINRIKSRIQKISEFNNQNFQSRKLKIKYIRDFDFMKNKILQENMAYSYYENKNFFICDKPDNKCKIYIADEKDIKQILRQRFILNGKKIIFLGFKNNLYNLKEYNQNKRYWIENFIDGFKIKYTNENSITFDKNKKEIFLKINKHNSRFIVEDGSISNWKFFIDTDNEVKTNQYQRLQTGCLTFYNVQFKKVEIHTKNSQCEDAINIIRSKGHISLMTSYKSKFDSFDFDFSKITIDHLIAQNSNNDCADFSFGDYYIKKIDTKICKDKGISVGENSKVIVDNFSDYNSNISIAVKDSSSVYIKNVKVNQPESCFRIYRKKQEFSNSFLKIGKMNKDCLVSLNFIQDKSIFEIENAQ